MGQQVNSHVPAAGTVDRREALRRVGLMLGGTALLGGSGLLTACAEGRRAAPEADGSLGAFTAEEIAYLDEIAETILPETDTPGAKAAGTGAFMALMVTDVYRPEWQDVFRQGMETLDERCRSEHGHPFMAASPQERLALLTALDRERLEHSGPSPHYFHMMKELALVGYFTSEIGHTVARRYAPNPGSYDPCVPYTPGETSWASLT